ncbi:FliM/FliN family flagellar motor switch protein [Buchnera aphidicola (Chaitoregma tattakana)]|uniref:FliM/FliN family flagellar motor switch protein n=1 Tax=Buchnera aphidicola TaxID=9 RepID=UPI0031B80204
MDKYYNNFIHVNKILKKIRDITCRKNFNIDKNFISNEIDFSNILYADLNNIYFKEKFLLEKSFNDFSNSLSIKLSNLLNYKIQIDVKSIKIETYKKCFKNIGSLISFNCFKISSIKSFGSIIYSHDFVLNMLEFFFGGKNNFLNYKDFKNISYSQNFINYKITKIFTKNLSHNLEKNFNLKIFSYNSKKFFEKSYKNFFYSNNFIVRVCFNCITGKYSNLFNIFFPWSFIKYVNNIVVQNHNKISEKSYSKKNFYIIKSINFVMSAFLQFFFINLYSLYNLNINDVIKIYNPVDVYIFIDDKLFFLGKNTVLKNRISVLVKRSVYLKHLTCGDKMNNQLEKFKKYVSENDSILKKDEKKQTVFLDNTVEEDDLDNRINYVGDIKIKMSVRLGRIKMKAKKLLSIKCGSILQLDQLAGEPLDILANGCLIAKGEIVVIKNNYGIRIVNILNNVNKLK